MTEITSDAAILAYDITWQSDEALCALH